MIADEDDEVELDWWDGSGVFGIKPSTTRILDAEARDLSSSGSTAPRSTRNKRRYSFDGTHFTKHDPNPHLVSLQPVVQMRQLTLLDNDVIDVVHSEAPLQDPQVRRAQTPPLSTVSRLVFSVAESAHRTGKLLTVTHQRR